MKKKFNILTVMIVAVLSLATGVGAAGAYIQWAGTEDYNQVMENWGLVGDKANQLKEERDSMKTKKEMAEAERRVMQTEMKQLQEERDILNGWNSELERTVEQQENTLLDKEQEIASLGQEIEALKKQIAGGKTTQSQLEQAEKDMKDVRNKSEEVLESINQ